MPKITASYATEVFMDWYAVQSPEKQEAIILSLKTIARQNRRKSSPLFDRKEVVYGAPVDAPSEVVETVTDAEPMATP